MDMRPFDLPTLVGSLITGHAAEIAERDVQVGLRIRGAAGGRLFGDSRRIAALLDDCLRRTLATLPRRIEIIGTCTTAAIGAGHVRISVEIVADTGISTGIGGAATLARNPQISAVLRRLDARLATAPDEGGIVEWLTVAFDVECEHETGTTASDGRPMKVVFADDDEISRDVLRAMMDHIGAESIGVCNGADLIAAWRESDCDLVLLDVLMPVVDGVTAAQRIRAEEAVANRPRTPIIAVSAIATRQQEELCGSAGIDALVTKPLQIDYLYATIRRLTGRALTYA